MNNGLIKRMAESIGLHIESCTKSTVLWLMDLNYRGFNADNLPGAVKLLGSALLIQYKQTLFVNDVKTYQFLEAYLSDRHHKTAKPAFPPMGLIDPDSKKHNSTLYVEKTETNSASGGDNETFKMDQQKSRES
jgi:hypothetical protein